LDNNNNKKEPWRIVIGIISIGYIIFMLVKKDIVTIYTTMPSEQVLPLIVTTIAVTLFKVLGITVVILLFKWIISKIKNRNK
jgi:hypothetical protein